MPSRTSAPEPSTPVEELWNLSDKTGGWLRRIGISTYGQLEQADLFDVWVQLKLEHGQVSKLMYYAMWGAVHNAHWNTTPQTVKDEFDKNLQDITKTK